MSAHVRTTVERWYCHDARHETPCPLPCTACLDECDLDTWRVGAAREAER